MIHVTIYENDSKECIGFQTKGHAEYAEMGQDLSLIHIYTKSVSLHFKYSVVTHAL